MNGEHAGQELTQALTTIEPRDIAPRLPLEQDIEMLGRAMAASGFFKDIKSANQAMVKILAGKEIGLPPIAAMTGIHLIDGKVSLGANLIAAAVKRSGRYNYRVREQTPTCCRIEFFEHGESVGVSEFTMADAQQAGITNKAVWRQYPRNMLFARALTNGARWYCADVFGGAVYTPEELDHQETIPYVEQSAAVNHRTEPQATPPPADTASHVAPTQDGGFDVGGASQVGADEVLAADLDAAFTAQAPKGVGRYDGSKGAQQFKADCQSNLNLDLDQVQGLLGETVAAYMRERGKTLGEVYAILVNKALDNEPVPGRLGEPASAATE